MTSPLSPEAVAQMVADISADRAIGMPDHGGWAWFGGRDHVFLGTKRGGRHYVMDFVRKGMKSAQPRFQIKGCMHNAVDKLTTYEVGDGTARGQAQADADPTVYRLDVSGIDHPDARRMTRIPDMERAVLTLAAENATLRHDNDIRGQNMRDTWEAMQAMRDAINEHMPLPSIESDLMQGPENSVFCEVVATAVIGELATLRASEAAALDRVKVLTDLMQWSYDTLGEINPSNYDHDDVCSLNNKSIEVILALHRALTPTAEPTEYERKVAQMKEDFPNGI